MFLKAGAVSLALLLASRLVGLARESAQAAAFGTSGLADVVVLMLTLPDWLTGLLASGALAYVLMPAWAGEPAAVVDRSQRRVALWLLIGGAALALCLIVFRQPAVSWLASGLPPALRPLAAQALVWSALAFPLALLAALWGTRLQHARDFLGLYAANLVVNGALIAAIAGAAQAPVAAGAVLWLGAGLLAAMGLRLVWLWRRQRRGAAPSPTLTPSPVASLPPVPVWLWAVLSAGLPLLLPFVARSIASRGGEGALSTFNYAWKLVELPLVLAIQLVATLAFPAIAAALSFRATPVSVAGAAAPVRAAFALAWTLACAAAAALLVGAPALAELVFGWGRVSPESLTQIAQWGSVAAWGLLPQALIAVTLTVLAAQSRLKIAAAAYALALIALAGAAALGIHDGVALMRLLNALFAGVALATLAAMGRPAHRWLPWRSMGLSLAGLLVVAVVAAGGRLPVSSAGVAGGLAAALIAAAAIVAATWLGSRDLRLALRR